MLLNGSKKMKNILKTYRIQSGYILSLLFIIFSEYNKGYFITGLVLAFSGLLYRLWASGYISKNKTLAIGGPYLFSRHPLYFGSFLMGLGFSLICGRIILLLIFIIFFLIVYFPLMRDEERHLINLFGEEYLNYMKDVPMFFPAGNLRPLVPVSFKWRLVLRNKEYRAWLGFSVFLVLLLLKFYFTGS